MSRWAHGVGLAGVLLGGAGALVFDVGSAHAESATAPQRIYATAYTVWIYAKPARSKQPLGYLRAGQHANLKTGEVAAHAGCANGWYEVEPMGFLCHDQNTTFAPTRYVKSMWEAAASSAPLPFAYALSNGAPMYRRLPGPDEWQHEERYFGPAGSFGALSWGNRGHERLAEVRPIAASADVPWFLKGDGSVSRANETRLVRRTIPLGSMLSYTRVFEHAGRTWLFSADGTVVPADRVRPFRPSRFKGVTLSAGGTGSRTAYQLPLAWVRKQPRPKYRRTAEGRIVATEQIWPLRTAVRLDGGEKPLEVGRTTYLATLERDALGQPLYIEQSAATVVSPRDSLPWGIGEHDKWIVFSITRGTLVAYEGETPVFTTLASPGAGGVPVEGHDPVKWSTTPMGRYRVTFKHWAADMSPEHGEHRSFWIANVPYTQYFSPPFAIHVAYWHEDFGEPMSAGCINVSPEDGKWLFGWTDPPLPSGWNGVGPTALNGRGTTIIVQR